MSTRKYVSLSKLSTFLDNLKRTFAPIEHNHDSDYDSKGSADDALEDAKSYTDEIASGKSDTSHTHAELENIVYTSEENQETATVPLNADTLQGYAASSFIKTTDTVNANTLQGYTASAFAPAMVAGIEYLTAERFNGSPVYTKLLSIAPSAISSQTIAINHGVSNLDIGLSINVNWYRSSDSSWRSFPSAYYNGTAWMAQVYWLSTNQLKFELGSTILTHIQGSTKNIFITLKYTKTA